MPAAIRLAIRSAHEAIRRRYVPLKIVFFGTSEFAVPALRALHNAHTIDAVITQPDRPAGRGKQLTATPVRAAAEALQIPVHTPERIRTEAAWLQARGADLFVVVSYGQILPAAILTIPPLGALNIHPSALPLYRGANPIAAPIRDGRRETALSIIAMDAGMDTGDIVLQEITPIGPDETGTALHDRLAEHGADALLRVLDALAAGTLTPRPQATFPHDPAEITATLTRPVRNPDLLIDWHKPAGEIAALVRAYADVPAARAELFGERVKVLGAKPVDLASGDAAPGELIAVTSDAVVIAAGDRTALAVTAVIPPGRSRQTGAEFARRFRKTLP